jgi:hypothetical protein
VSGSHDALNINTCERYIFLHSIEESPYLHRVFMLSFKPCGSFDFWAATVRAWDAYLASLLW